MKNKFKDICRDIRIAITGKESGPPLFQSMEILGYEECMKRLKFAYKQAMKGGIMSNIQQSDASCMHVLPKDTPIVESTGENIAGQEVTCKGKFGICMVCNAETFVLVEGDERFIPRE